MILLFVFLVGFITGFLLGHKTGYIAGEDNLILDYRKNGKNARYVFQESFRRINDIN